MESTVIDSVISVLPSAVSVSSSVADAQAIDFAKDYLQGYSGEYVFFQSGGGELYTPYYLVCADTVEYDAETGVVTAYEGCTVYCIGAVRELVIPNTESFTGTVVGTEEEAFRGTYQRQSYTVTEYVTGSFFVESITVDTQVLETGARFVVYGSAEGLPHLIDGQQNYLYLISALVVGSFAFVLIDRIFRRVI